MTDTEDTENTELNAQSESSESSESDAELSAQSETDQSEADEETGGINEEHAQELASADYQKRMEEFDNADSPVPVTTVPATGESGTVEMPKSQ